MSLAGHIYGVVLNDRDELGRLAAAFTERPYSAPPDAPVVYMKPRSAIGRCAIPHSADDLVCAATIALLFARDAACVSDAEALDCVGAVALAVDFSLPQSNYYRPAIAQANGDGFLVLGDWTAPNDPGGITTSIDGSPAHEWRLDRLARGPARLIAEISSFMTLRAGDVLLVGLPGDAPRAKSAQRVRIEANGLAPIDLIAAEKAA
jgi:5-oxopent-3-ene-1,2,5-tricarboxylate decarboxylase/2-hydroxyhepta-2,4-diene-1,7-dioate isomerase